ncbi:MAG: ABC transporter permease [Piscirickettsiaceae bacterium]|nr:MAG: ABC transporter permease [Piscirickettsiaceae bacterium]
MASRRQHIQRPNSQFNLKLYAHIHLHSFFASLGRLARAPFNFMMTVGVIAITLSLPAGMLVSIENLKAVSGQIDFTHNISIFLNHTVSLDKAKLLAKKIEKSTKVSKTKLIDKQAALEEFRQYSGFGSALSSLGENPLPHVIQVSPVLSFNNPAALKSLVLELRLQPDIKLVQMDMSWLERLNAILNIAQRGVTLITILLAIAVLLIVSNTIRLELQSRRDEIDTTRLVGATHAFIRRPFVYSGFWYGLLGGIGACLLVTLSLWLLDGPTNALSTLYNSPFNLSYMSFNSILFWLLLSILLGVIGSWVVVTRHLNQLEQ